MRCREDTDIDKLLVGGPDLAHFFLLDRAQKLDLHCQRQIGHLVEKQCSAIRSLEKPIPITIGSGKRPLAVPEKLAFHEVLGDGAAIHRNEGRRVARALTMDQTSRKLFAAARLARNVDRCLTTRQLTDHLAHIDNSRRFPGKLPHCAFGRHRRITLRFVDLRKIECRLDQGTKLLERNRLGQIIERPGLQRRYGIVSASVGRNHRHRRFAIVRADQPHDVQPFTIGKTHIGQAQTVLLALQKFSGFGNGASTVC